MAPADIEAMNSGKPPMRGTIRAWNFWTPVRSWSSGTWPWCANRNTTIVARNEITKLMRKEVIPESADMSNEGHYGTPQTT
jgi:hypothetical protein